MNSESPVPTGASPSQEADTASTVASLRFLMQCLLMGLIVMSIAVEFFFNGLRPIIQSMIP